MRGKIMLVIKEYIMGYSWNGMTKIIENFDKLFNKAALLVFLLFSQFNYSDYIISFKLKLP